MLLDGEARRDRGSGGRVEPTRRTSDAWASRLIGPHPFQFAHAPTVQIAVAAARNMVVQQARSGRLLDHDQGMTPPAPVALDVRFPRTRGDGLWNGRGTSDSDSASEGRAAPAARPQDLRSRRAGSLGSIA